MPKRITINPHLSVKELENRYRAAKSSVERSHYQIVWLLAQGKTTEEVAAVTGYCRDWIRKLVRRYNNQGAAGLANRRCNYRGALPRVVKTTGINSPYYLLLPVADYCCLIVSSPLSKT